MTSAGSSRLNLAGVGSRGIDGELGGFEPVEELGAWPFGGEFDDALDFDLRLNLLPVASRLAGGHSGSQPQPRRGEVLARHAGLFSGRGGIDKYNSYFLFIFYPFNKKGRACDE